MAKQLKCAKSDKPCSQCELNLDCLMYSHSCELSKQLKKLEATLEDTLTIVKAILGVVG